MKRVFQGASGAALGCHCHENGRPVAFSLAVERPAERDDRRQACSLPEGRTEGQAGLSRSWGEASGFPLAQEGHRGQEGTQGAGAPTGGRRKDPGSPLAREGHV